MIRGLLDTKIDFIFKNIFGAEKNKSREDRFDGGRNTKVKRMMKLS